MTKPAAYPTNPPRLLPSFVCYVDILGYKQLSKECLNEGKGEEFLDDLRDALTVAYERIRQQSSGWGFADRFLIKVFTDNIVLGYPLPNFNADLGEEALGDIFSIFSEYQVGLAMKGFFVRGGIAFGDLYMDEDIVFGNGLLEAIDQDKSGGPPRITLCSSAIEILHKHFSFYPERKNAPQYQDVLEDSDGAVFLNYLDEAFIAFPDGGIFFDVIQDHKSSIEKGLAKYKNSPDIKAKYEWLARYHNFICNEFMSKHPVPDFPDYNELYASAAIEAQELCNYLIDIDSYTTSPMRLLIDF